MQYRCSLASECFSLSIPSRGTVQAFDMRRAVQRISVDSTFRLRSASLAQPASRLLCPLLTFPRRSAPIARHSAPIFRSTGEISRGKTRNCHCVDAGFTKCTPLANGGLRGHVPARPRCTTPHIRFLFIAPQLRVQLPSDPASRRRPCRFPNLRLYENLVAGLSPT